MMIEKHFEEFDKEAFNKETFEDSRIDDAFDILDEGPEPHFDDIKVRKDLTSLEFEAAEKFKKEELTEEEVSRMLEKVAELGEHNPRYTFLAGLKNKILSEKGRERVEELRRKRERGEKKEGSGMFDF